MANVVIIDSLGKVPIYKWIKAPYSGGLAFDLTTKVELAQELSQADADTYIAELNGIAGNEGRFYSGNPTSTPPPKPF